MLRQVESNCCRSVVAATQRGIKAHMLEKALRGTRCVSRAEQAAPGPRALARASGRLAPRRRQHQLSYMRRSGRKMLLVAKAASGAPVCRDPAQQTYSSMPAHKPPATQGRWPSSQPSNSSKAAHSTSSRPQQLRDDAWRQGYARPASAHSAPLAVPRAAEAASFPPSRGAPRSAIGYSASPGPAFRATAASTPLRPLSAAQQQPPQAAARQGPPSMPSSRIQSWPPDSRRGSQAGVSGQAMPAAAEAEVSGGAEQLHDVSAEAEARESAANLALQEDEQAAPDQLQRLRELMAQEEGEVAEAERAGPEAAEADRRARTCLVEDASEARRVAQLLMGWARDKADVLTGEPLVFGCDTETTGVDPTKESAVGHGHVICFSVYCRHPRVDFRQPGSEGPRQGRLWVDIMQTNEEEARQTLEAFREFFQDPRIHKAWHNYSFDRHVMFNTHQVDCQGLAGDTVHMARLWSSSRKGKLNYSLESLSSDSMVFPGTEDQGKTKMKELFGVPKLRKDGTVGKILELPDTRLLQESEQRNKWIEYSVKDAVSTLRLYYRLQELLRQNECMMRPEVHAALQSQAAGQPGAAIRKPISTLTFSIPPPSRAQAAPSKPQVPQASPTFRQSGAAGRSATASQPGQQAPPAQGSNGMKNGAAAGSLRQRYGNKGAAGNGASVAGQNGTQPLQNGNGAVGPEQGSMLPPLSRQQRVGNKGCFVKRSPQRYLGPDLVPAETYSMWDFYCDQWRPFGELLTAMEREGFLVNREHLRTGELRARSDQELAVQTFRDWAQGKVEAAATMNIGSGAQIRQLLFAGAANEKAEKGNLELERAFKTPNPDYDPDFKAAKGVKKPLKCVDQLICGLWGRGNASPLHVSVYTAGGWPAVSTPVLRSLAGKSGAARKALALKGCEDANQLPDPEALQDMADELDSMPPLDIDEDAIQTGLGLQEADNAQGESDKDRWKKEAKVGGFGSLYAAFGGGLEGLRACAAVEALCSVSAIDTLLSNFLEPLQGPAIATQTDGVLGRVHCSLNINTETGRLSARRPNLQNQPSGDKDIYHIRKAFRAKPGHTLVVADYGQLELRILAAMADCKSMQEAFRLGGDFHSRTALGMYDNIKEAIKAETCILEWDGGEDHKPSPTPLLKDMFANERKKAKILNFSIAYGKTAHGLAKDWGTSLSEAEETVERWYSDRPEVRKWQEEQRQEAIELGRVRTIMGRQRMLPDAQSRGAARGHALRAAINTPIQGSAADIANAAMLSIARQQQLQDMGWRLLLQVHDEVIVEGPKETADIALQLIEDCMQRPFNGRNPFEDKVQLLVDAKYADTWYEAK